MQQATNFSAEIGTYILDWQNHTYLSSYRWLDWACRLWMMQSKSWTIHGINYRKRHLERGPLRDVDRLGYSDLNTDMIVMGASSGQKDDTLKNTHGSICALETSLRRYPHARFMTATNLLAFSVQSFCTIIILSTTSRDPSNPGKYIHHECRMTEIPMNYGELIK